MYPRNFKVNMINIDIKEVSGNDILKLQEIGRITFSETFSASNSEENMVQYLKEGFSIQKLTG